jgi:hypothetical protein
MMAPKIAQTVPETVVIEASKVDLFMLASAVHDDAVRENNWTVYNTWHEVLRDYYPKKEA